MPPSSQARSNRTKYLYDPFGRRIRKSGTSGTTFFLSDGDRLLAEYDGSGDRQVRYAYAQGFAPVQVAYNDGGETIYDVHSDHLDTPRMLTDDAGVPSWRASYEAFGRAHISTDPRIGFKRAIERPGRAVLAGSCSGCRRARFSRVLRGRAVE